MQFHAVDPSHPTPRGGRDYRAPVGTPVHTPESGTVAFAGPANTAGIAYNYDIGFGNLMEKAIKTAVPPPVTELAADETSWGCRDPGGLQTASDQVSLAGGLEYEFSGTVLRHG